MSTLSTLDQDQRLTLKRKAVRGAGISAGAKFCSFVVQTGGVIVLARLLKPEDFGLVAMVAAISTWLMNFGLNGFPEFIIQKRKIEGDEITAIFWVHIIISGVLAAAFCGLGPILASFYAQPELVAISAAMASSIILSALYTHHQALLKRDLRFSSVAAGYFLAVLASTALAIAAAAYGLGYWAVVIRQLTLPMVIAIGVWILCSWRPGRPRNLRIAIPAVRYALYVYGNFSLAYVGRSIDKVLLGRWQGPAVLGQYDRAYHLSSIPAGQLLTPLHSVALATLSRLKDDRQTFCRYFRKAVATVAVLGVCAAVLLMISASDVIHILLGAEWKVAGQVLTALSPGIGALLIYETHSWLHLSLGTPGRWLRWNIASSLFTVVTFLLAAPFGAVAMAITFSAQKFVLLVPGLWYAARPVQLSVKDLTRGIWAPMVSGVIVGLLWFYGIRIWLPMPELADTWSRIGGLALGLAVATFLYGGLLILLSRSLDPIRELISLGSIVFRRNHRPDDGERG
jgi:O-antigen/teichoic acid export membrane protein